MAGNQSRNLKYIHASAREKRRRDELDALSDRGRTATKTNRILPTWARRQHLRWRLGIHPGLQLLEISVPTLIGRRQERNAEQSNQARRQPAPRRKMPALC